MNLSELKIQESILSGLAGQVPDADEAIPQGPTPLFIEGSQRLRDVSVSLFQNTCPLSNSAHLEGDNIIEKLKEGQPTMSSCYSSISHHKTKNGSIKSRESTFSCPYPQKSCQPSTSTSTPKIQVIPHQFPRRSPYKAQSYQNTEGVYERV